MIKKVEREFGDNFFDNHKDRLLLICSADGARHQITSEGDLNVISFNMTLTSKALLAKEYTTTQSHNILTFMQVTSDKTDYIVLTAYNQFCKDRAGFSSYNLDEKYHNLNIDMLELHDAKFVYALTQHFLFSREYYLFLLCRCSRGTFCNTNNDTSVCNLISDDDYEKLQQKAKKKLKKLLRDKYSGKSLTDLTDSEFPKAMKAF